MSRRPDPSEPFDLILASASPRRRELLERMGLRLKVAPIDLDESPHAGEKAGDYVRRLAAAKCDAAVAALPAGGDQMLAVLGADTIVILDGAILGKPRDVTDARAMLGRLAGRRHEVTTAYRVWRGRPGTDPVAARLDPAAARIDPAAARIDPAAARIDPAAARIDPAAARIIDRAVTTQVAFRLLQPAEIDAYAACGEWEGKAGGYAVQGIAAAFTTELRGSHTNVIGLPLAEVVADLLAAGALTDYPRAAFGISPDAVPA